jgi:hypothetical protein
MRYRLGNNGQMETPQPPQPPEIKRKIQFALSQKIGIPILMLIPVLALLGFLGETMTEASTSSSDLSVRVEYPPRTRYLLPQEVTIHVQNTTSENVPIIMVDIGADYIDGFTQVAFSPDVDEVTGEAYRVELTDVDPGESRVVNIDIRGYSYGPRRDTVRASVDESGASVEVPIQTFIFP